MGLVQATAYSILLATVAIGILVFIMAVIYRVSSKHTHMHQRLPKS